MSPAKTVITLLERGEDAAVAIAASGRLPLTYAGLRRHIANTVETLNKLGIGRNDSVAIVLPNGWSQSWQRHPSLPLAHPENRNF